MRRWCVVMAAGVSSVVLAQDFPYKPLGADTPLPPIKTSADAMDAGKSFGAGAKTGTQGMVSTTSADFAVPGYNTNPKEAAYFDPNRIPKDEGNQRKNFCASTDLTKLSLQERKECEAINFLSKRKNDAHFTIDKKNDPLFKGYQDAKSASVNLASSSCELPSSAKAQSFTEHGCTESVLMPQTCRESLAVGVSTEEKDVDFSFVINTDLRKYRAYCNDDEGRMAIWGSNFAQNELVKVGTGMYRYVGIEASHAYGSTASCKMEEMSCERNYCDRTGTCTCINPSPTGKIVVMNQFLKEFTWWGEEDDGNIWVNVDLEHGTAAIQDANLIDNGGVIMSWRETPTLQMQGRSAVRVTDKPEAFNCSLFGPQNFRVVSNASGGECAGMKCTVGTANITDVDYRTCTLTVHFGKSGGNFHGLHDGAGARWTNKITVRMFAKVPTFHNDVHGNCPAGL